jgi:hypothetical protein
MANRAGIGFGMEVRFMDGKLQYSDESGKNRQELKGQS